MKYMLLVYADERVWTDPERDQCFAESIQLAHELKERGKYLAANPLQSVLTATSVRIRGGKSLITDGPFAETREQLGGYFLVEAGNLDEAIAVAKQIPGVHKGTVEIRPILEIPGMPAE